MNHDPKRCTRHRKYSLTCTDFDSLHAEVNSCCTICGTPEAQTNRKLLVIDHDARLGFWAGRGVLCQNCNIALGWRLEMPGRQHYLDNAWHLKHRPHLPPVAIPVVPDATPEEAYNQLRYARSALKRASKGSPQDRRWAYGRMRDAVRIAAKCGMRTNEIVQSVSRIWDKEQVYCALHHKGRRVI